MNALGKSVTINLPPMRLVTLTSLPVARRHAAVVAIGMAREFKRRQPAFVLSAVEATKPNADGLLSVHVHGRLPPE